MAANPGAVATEVHQAGAENQATVTDLAAATSRAAAEVATEGTGGAGDQQPAEWQTAAARV